MKTELQIFSGTLLTHFKLDERAFLSNALTHTEIQSLVNIVRLVTVIAMFKLVSVNV